MDAGVGVGEVGLMVGVGGVVGVGLLRGRGEVHHPDVLGARGRRGSGGMGGGVGRELDSGWRGVVVAEGYPDRPAVVGPHGLPTVHRRSLGKQEEHGRWL